MNWFIKRMLFLFKDLSQVFVGKKNKKKSAGVEIIIVRFSIIIKLDVGLDFIFNFLLLSSPGFFFLILFFYSTPPYSI